MILQNRNRREADVTELQLGKCGFGTSGIISKVEGNSPAILRLLEMGLVPGEWIQILQKGNPSLIQVGETRLCVRLNELDGVTVIPVEKYSDATDSKSVLQSDLPEVQTAQY